MRLAYSDSNTPPPGERFVAHGDPTIVEPALEPLDAVLRSIASGPSVADAVDRRDLVSFFAPPIKRPLARRLRRCHRYTTLAGGNGRCVSGLTGETAPYPLLGARMSREHSRGIGEIHTF
jgi:hypothetical protein